MSSPFNWAAADGEAPVALSPVVSPTPGGLSPGAVAGRRGGLPSEGWALGKDGNPVTDSKEALEK